MRQDAGYIIRLKPEFINLIKKTYMKKILYLSFIFIIFILLSCNKKQISTNNTTTNTTLKVGLVFDVGGKGDKSFNDAAYKGLERAKKVFGIDFEVVDPGEGSDRESAIRRFATRDDISLIFGIGFIFTNDITRIAEEFPNKKFACVDYTINEGSKIPDNLIALEFREDEGSFLVGVIAALTTKTNFIGFVGGMESPLIKKFENGFIAGAKYVKPDIKVKSAYIGVTGEAFKNPSKGKEIALSMYDNNVDIIYHASGLSGKGVFEAAKQKNLLAIGVDQDQIAEAPGNILTSMTKQVDEVVYQAIMDMKDGKFKGGIKILGLKEKGVDYVYDENNKNLISEETRKKVEEIRQKIINGEIKIHN